MATPTQTVAENLLALGVYDIILFAIFAAIFYAVLKKTKFLGDSPVIIGIITGASSLLANITSFFTQAAVISIVFLVGFLIAGFFYPNLTDMLKSTFTRRSTLMVMVTLGFLLFLTSGLVGVIWAPFTTPSNTGNTDSNKIPQNTLLLIAGISIFMMMLIVAAGIVRSE